MKYLLGILSVIAIVLVFVFCPMGQTESEMQYLRIHIRANSNLEEDQTVKYKVKDEIVETLIPILSEVTTLEEAKKAVIKNIPLIEEKANATLKKEGFTYLSKAKMDNEYFPTRVYEGLTLEEGYYDALILELGSGEGNNWWCLVFPAFCFTKTQNSDNIVYISRIWEIIKSVF